MDDDAHDATYPGAPTAASWQAGIKPATFRVFTPDQLGEHMNTPLSTDQVRMLERAALGPLIDRIETRFARAAELHQWGTNPHAPEPGSVMAADENGLLTNFSSNPVMWMASYPIATGTENMLAAGYMFSKRHETRKTRIGPVLAECRGALESASRAIWLPSLRHS